MKKLTILALALMATSAGMAQSQPVDYVSTLVGTQSTFQLSTGNTYPATAMPWGMNFWTPQTGKMGDGWTLMVINPFISSAIEEVGSIRKT